MVEIKGEFEQNRPEVKAPSDLELQGLKRTAEKLIDKYTQVKAKDVNLLKRDYTFKDKNWEIELEEQVNAGFLTEWQYINSIFIDRSNKVLVKVFDEQKDDFIFYELWV